MNRYLKMLAGLKQQLLKTAFRHQSLILGPSPSWFAFYTIKTGTWLRRPASCLRLPLQLCVPLICKHDLNSFGATGELAACPDAEA